MSDQISLPRGFRAAGVACGIKADPQTLDLALFVSDVPCAAAGVFTQNRVCGAPVQISRSRLPRATARAVIVNSGNANACTGTRGLDDARWMTAETATRLGCAEDDVLVCSTGVIGVFLPREKLAAGFSPLVDALAATPPALTAAAEAMMTTDTVPKLSARSLELAGRPARVCGVAKGAAMIAPNMATMLAVIMTDAAFGPPEAQRLLEHAVRDSFNCISVDGHTSTSDTVLLLANGAVERGPQNDDQTRALQAAVDAVAQDLAQAIIRDAEGAHHFIRIDVSGLPERDDAVRVARAVADSPLVKTAITGADPNWGRIVSAAGYAGVEFQESELSLRLNGTLLYERGAPVSFDEAAVSQTMREHREVTIALDFQRGSARAHFWTSDLTKEYVELNSEYTT